MHFSSVCSGNRDKQDQLSFYDRKGVTVQKLLEIKYWL